MSQDVSTNQGVREPLMAPPPIKPWSAESDADKLMDELFSDIDQILDGTSKLPTEPVKPEYVSLQSLVIPQITMPPAVIQPQELVPQPNPEPSELKPVGSSEMVLAQTANTPATRSGWSFESFLWAAGIASLLGTIILLLIKQDRLTWPWSLNPVASSSTQNNQVADSDAQFGSYMLRSLDVIDRKTQANQQAVKATGGSGTTNLPPVSDSGNSSAASNQTPTVLERVYIPVYPSQAPSAFPAPSAVGVRPSAPPPLRIAKPSAIAPARAVKPSTPAPARAVKPSTPAPAKAAKPSTPAPAKAAKPSTPVPARAAKPSTPAPSAAAPAPAVGTTLPVASPAVTAAKHTLVGLLELGEQSAALFDITGITQRINVGQAIGASGWTLVSVANQEAVIRRNGEVRSVYVGQKF